MTPVTEGSHRKKALAYTAVICISLLLLFFLISWKIVPSSPPVVQDLIEINLGNDVDGWGEKQPLRKGSKSPDTSIPETIPSKPTASSSTEKVEPNDDGENDAAPIVKPDKKKSVTKSAPTTQPMPIAATKPQKPKLTYNGPGKGNGNNATEDNGYKYQGTTAGGKGDAGNPNGHKDSYGNDPGGRVGNGPRVTKGNRKIIRNYSFQGELPKATIYAIIKVSAGGQGSFTGFDKGSTSRNQSYANEISKYLKNIQFDKSSDESVVTVQFNFTY